MIAINLVAIADTVELEPCQGPKEMVILLLLFGMAIEGHSSPIHVIITTVPASMVDKRFYDKEGTYSDQISTACDRSRHPA